MIQNQFTKISKIKGERPARNYLYKNGGDNVRSRVIIWLVNSRISATNLMSMLQLQERKYRDKAQTFAGGGSLGKQ